MREVSLDVEKERVTGLLALDQIMKRELAEVLIGYKEFKGELLIDGKRLTTDELRGVRWRRIAYIPPDPSSLFDPLYDVRSHVLEVSRAHGIEENVAVTDFVETLEDFDLREDLLDEFPHMLDEYEINVSALALALSVSPDYVILHDPSRGLDELELAYYLKVAQRVFKEIDAGFLVMDSDPKVMEITDVKYVGHGGMILEVVRGEYMHPFSLDVTSLRFPLTFRIGQGCPYWECRLRGEGCEVDPPKGELRCVKISR
ncbi:ABC-type dipeptide/oligopeptide/nickel transport system, ATPase component [Metallosphaera yellowstonensis MK1]|uniref:ABC-type dipeptide/oligopeptide/nickel transport system, ATPase component n=1 Tax=Metallosphaera yellowstonensis MK1 TaxID=671065 RepID=H2C4F2_9CREN|nr:peptide ABC transporter ATPase [Metallosphaera yellowstonensis]EHP69817.1 ABC-type dipeptide/oligopeptide/nickel transport system, ATPase component [Metallosphaera yellowstonensis MK1]